MNIKNMSAEITEKIYNWIPHDLQYSKAVVFPDICPGKSPLPTGISVLTSQKNWRKYALSDVGCGFLFIKPQSIVTLDTFRRQDWYDVGILLKENKSKLGDLGSGNHFCDSFISMNSEELYFAIHTGSRLEGEDLINYIDNPKLFDQKYKDTVNYAFENRAAVAKILEKVFGKTNVILDKAHNSYEIIDEENVIIRKGTVKLNPGELSIIPSSMEGDMVLVRAKEEINNCLNSISHGTGRCRSRSSSKLYAETYNFEKLRKNIYIPEYISNTSIKTEAPFCYRDINTCMDLLKDIVEEEDRYIPIAYIGQL